MQPNILSLMRELKRETAQLSESASDDHKPFKHTLKPLFCFRLPSKPDITRDDLSVTPTCTTWMALACTRSLETHYDDPEITSHLADALGELMGEPWDTGRLPQNNAFTVAILSRALGYLRKENLLDDNDLTTNVRRTPNYELSYTDKEKPQPDITRPIPKTEPWRKCHDKDIISIVREFLNNPERALALAPFPASPAIAYWMIDAAIKLSAAPDQEGFQDLAKWAATEFRRQYSLMAAQQQASMDPVALAMAACVCKALRRHAVELPDCYNSLKDLLFPTDGELEAGIRAFFSFQNSSGVWEKYFPIFHYPASGPNHCWHFEVLEAVISEFPAILTDITILQKLHLSLKWLKSNRLSFTFENKTYSGWNGGGDIQALRRGEPESWPTGVAHMFLAKLNEHLAEVIKAEVLNKYRSQVTFSAKDSGKAWKNYLDFTFTKAKECGIEDSRNSVKLMIEEEILKPAEKDLETDHAGSHFRLTQRHSAVLFGPPGTSKTKLCSAVASRLGWPLLELSPSDFLGGGMPGIYDKVSEVFEDLLDLHQVVILFDEMDALVQSRESQSKQLDVTETLLTTSMLPKIQTLHKRSKTIFFMATNYFGSFDGAITRSGRFDLLIHMGPPSTAQKIKGLKNWCRTSTDAQIKAAQEYLTATINDEENIERFNRFTFGDTERFFYSILLKHNIECTATAITKESAQDIKARLKNWTDSKITLCDKSKTKGALNQFEADAARVSIQ